MSFKNLLFRQNEMKQKIKSPIYEFHQHRKSVRHQRILVQNVVYTISKNSKIIHIGRSSKSMSLIYEKLERLDGDAVEIFPFETLELAELFERRLIYFNSLKLD